MIKLILHPDDLPAIGINYSRSKLRRLEIAGQFPKRVRLGHTPDSPYGYVAEEIYAYMRELIAQRDAGQPGADDVR